MHEYRQRAGRICVRGDGCGGPLRSIKYGGRREYAAFYAEEILLRSLSREMIAALWQAEALVPIPLHPSTQTEAGAITRQSVLAAEAVERWMGHSRGT